MQGCSEKSTDPVQRVQAPVGNGKMPLEVQRLMDSYTVPDSVLLTELGLGKSPTNPPEWSSLDYDVYAVTLLWGHLQNHVTPPPANLTTDWSGNLGVNGVAIVSAGSTIDFEPHEDYLVPDSLPSIEEWVSFTHGDLDGLSALVLLKRGIVYIVAPMLTFDTRPIRIAWPFEALEDLSAFYLVDSINALAICAHRVWPHECPKGLIKGEWIRDDLNGRTGHWWSLWMAENGDPMGWLTATFWTESNGERLFSGWISGYLTDQIIAGVKGTWFYDDPRLCPMCGSSYGHFRGRFAYHGNDSGGAFEGTFGDFSLPPLQDTLPLVGRWHEDCPNTAWIVPHRD